jgi:DNA repair exonuclease SbcCD ATPase subunit
MKPLYLYLENFTCFRKTELDLSNITSAIIIGRQDHNELESNGIGKTSIFRAIEYALYAQTKHPVLGRDIVLERLIQDEAAKLVVVFDFELDGLVYRISRARTRKGSTDLTFFRRNTQPGNPHTPTTDKNLWDNLTCRRTADTDIQIAKLIGLKYKAFINTNHSMQLDIGGIATATPEKRRAILKDVFDLLPYAAMEKIIKQRTDNLLEAIRRDKTIISALGNPSDDITELNKQLTIIKSDIGERVVNVEVMKAELTTKTSGYLEVSSRLNALQTNTSNIERRKSSILKENSDLQASIENYTAKQKALIAEGKAIRNKAIDAKSSKEGLIGIDFSYLQKLQASLEENAEQLKVKSVALGIAQNKQTELDIPMPKDGTCKHCRSVLTPEHRQECLGKIAEEKTSIAATVSGLVGQIRLLQSEKKTLMTSLSQLEAQKKQLDQITTQLVLLDKEYADKRKTNEEYEALIKKFKADVVIKTSELEQVCKEIDAASTNEIKELIGEVANQKSILDQLNIQLDLLNKHLNEAQSKEAVILHSIEEKSKDQKRVEELRTNIDKLEQDYSIFPFVIRSFEAIPDLIIESVIEGLEDETNTLLSQMRPDLRLEFMTEKTKSDGTQDDTLGINYYLNNKLKDYSQLSGAQQLCVMFAFKLGLSFLLAKMNGSQIKFLMLDEVDMPFSPAAVDAYADIIHFFQKEFTVFVITHNERLKSKFSNAIMVEQDRNGISRAKVVSI